MPAPHTHLPLLAALLCLGGSALAQDGRPTPEPAAPATAQPVVEVVDVAGEAADIPAPKPGHALANGSRREAGDDRVILAFDDVTIEDTIPFIVQTTGKVVMPVNVATLRAKKVTLINDRPLDRNQALDLLVEAFKLNDVGVVEYDDRIVIALLSEMPRINNLVVGPDEDIMQRTDRGTVIYKIFGVENTDAEALADQLAESLPDHASMTVDPNSNQIIVMGDVGLVQRVGRMIQELDRNYVKIKTQTFRLAHADATEISQNILDLFEDSGTTVTRTGAGASRAATARMSPAERRRARQNPQPATADRNDGVGPSVELRITVNVQQNSVTISGEPSTVDEIAGLIENEWDKPRPETTKKVYHLLYTDPLKMRDMLQELLGGQSGVGGGAARRTRGAAPGGAGGRADVSEVIGGIYQIQAYPDSNSLVVICKTEESFAFLDSLIADLDQPVFPGIPLVVELKHADAEHVADQVNAIFAPAGARVDIARRQTGLAGIDIEGPTGGGGASGGGAAREGEQGGTITFPWQQGRAAEDQTPESPLIGKVRVVPIHRQNAVMILAAPEYRDSVRDIIVNDLDKPARQVMIAAIIAELQLTDELKLGLRVGSGLPIGPGDYTFGATGTFGATKTGILGGFFDMSTFTLTGGSVTAVLQALDQKTKFRILQEPVVFTADNQEASFFQGQDVPIVVNTQTDIQTLNTNVSTEYQAVGIGLNVRPRITIHGDVDMEINLEISNINEAETQATQSEGIQSPTFDRRETTTQVIVKDGQTIVMSGILRDLESKVKRKLPLLGDIPLLGALFTSIDDQTTSFELLAFITPYVVDNPDENDENFNENARQRLEDLSKPLKEQKPRPPTPEDIQRRLLYPGGRKYEPAGAGEPLEE